MRTGPLAIPAAPLALALALALALCLAAPVLAGPAFERIKQSGQLRVGLAPHNPPLTYQAQDGRIKGFEVDLSFLVAEALGLKLEVKPMAFDGLLTALEQGQVDMVISAMAMTPERNARVMFIGPYLVSGQGVLITERALQRLNEETELNQPDLVIAAAKGTTGAEAVRELFPKARLIEVEDQQRGLKAVLEGQASALVAEHNFCVIAALRYRDRGLTALEKPFTAEPLGMALVEDTLLANWLENFLGLLKASGNLERLGKHWFANPAWLKDLPPDKLL